MNCTLCGDDSHKARGLCPTHYELMRYHGQLADHPRRLKSREDLLEDYELLRSEGLPPRVIAARLGMKWATFDRAMWRARARGDSRALNYSGRAS